MEKLNPAAGLPKVCTWIDFTTKTCRVYSLFTSEVEIFSVVIGTKVNMFHNVSFGPVGVLTGPVLGGLQHGHTSVGEVSVKDGVQRSFFRAAR